MMQKEALQFHASIRVRSGHTSAITLTKTVPPHFLQKMMSLNFMTYFMDNRLKLLRRNQFWTYFMSACQIFKINGQLAQTLTNSKQNYIIYRKHPDGIKIDPAFKVIK